MPQQDNSDWTPVNENLGWTPVQEAKPEPTFPVGPFAGIPMSKVTAALPAVGGIAGGSLGSAIGPAGTIGGAALGGAAGSSLESLFDKAIGSQEAPGSLKEGAERAGVQGAIQGGGAGLMEGVSALLPAISSAGRTVLSSSQAARDLMQENGLAGMAVRKLLGWHVEGAIRTLAKVGDWLDKSAPEIKNAADAKQAIADAPRGLPWNTPNPVPSSVSDLPSIPAAHAKNIAPSAWERLTQAERDQIQSEIDDWNASEAGNKAQAKGKTVIMRPQNFSSDESYPKQEIDDYSELLMQSLRNRGIVPRQ